MLKCRTALILIVGFTFLIACGHQENKVASTVIIPDTPVIKMDPVNPFSPVDISPMDMSYFPDDFPVKKMAGEVSASPVMRVIYSRPHRQGRTIFGKLLKYGEPWRMGANEAAEIEFFKSVTINNKNVPASRYIIYCIPYQDKWTIILNSNIYTWGLKIDPKKDVERFDIPVAKSMANIEYFTMIFEEADNGANLIMTWDDVIARLNIKLPAVKN